MNREITAPTTNVTLREYAGFLWELSRMPMPISESSQLYDLMTAAIAFLSLRIVQHPNLSQLRPGSLQMGQGVRGRWLKLTGVRNRALLS
jgi:hypothetical protein